LATIIDVAGALGLRVTLEPIPAEEASEAPPVVGSPPGRPRVARSA
jgi:hypothetical protein